MSGNYVERRIEEGLVPWEGILSIEFKLGN